jgi:hypothetical protein
MADARLAVETPVNAVTHFLNQTQKACDQYCGEMAKFGYHSLACPYLQAMRAAVKKHDPIH